VIAARPLEIVPAIDLRGGRCVRLLYGDPARETRYDGDPLDRARAFERAGARTIHVVDLDGAFGTGENLAAIRAICAGVDARVQTGGGIRTLADANARIAAGADAIVIGTIIVEAPEIARAIVDALGARVVGGVDARGGAVAVRGWLEGTGRDRDEVVLELGRWDGLRYRGARTCRRAHRDARHRERWREVARRSVCGRERNGTERRSRDRRARDLRRYHRRRRSDRGVRASSPIDARNVRG